MPSNDRPQRTAPGPHPAMLTLITSVLVLATSGVASAQEASSAQARTLNEELLEPFKFRFIGPANPSGRVTAEGWIERMPGRIR